MSTSTEAPELADLIDEVTRQLGELKFYADILEVPWEDLVEAGAQGLDELHEKQVPLEDCVFAKAIQDRLGSLPVDISRSLCLAAGYLVIGLGLFKSGERYAVPMLMCGSLELGFLRGTRFGTKYKDSIVAQYGASVRHQNAPKQADKNMVKAEWDVWQTRPNMYKSNASFARAMLEKYPRLESQKVIAERWCKEWGK